MLVVGRAQRAELQASQQLVLEGERPAPNHLQVPSPAGPRLHVPLQHCTPSVQGVPAV